VFRALFFLLIPALVSGARPARFAEHVIAQNLTGGYQVIAADMNRDGKPDLIALASRISELVWYENPTWQRHVIASGFKRMINAAAVHVDSDGIPEIVLAHEFENQARNSVGIVSVLTHQKDLSQPWTVTEIDRIPTSHRLRPMTLGFKTVVVNAPLTGAQAEPPSYAGASPLVYYDVATWVRHHITGGQSTLAPDEGVVHGIYITDWDQDRKEDILTASFSGINLYRFDGSKWSKTQLAPGNPTPAPKGGSSDIAIGNLKKRRFLAAIEPWHGNEVAVYLPVKGSTQLQRIVIDTTLVDGHTVLATDLNGDSEDEIVAGFRGTGRSVFVYYAEKDGTRWRKEVLDNGGIAAAACAALDVNGDRRIDLACIGAATMNLKWYENLPEK
jgi:hypothetical protein